MRNEEFQNLIGDPIEYSYNNEYGSLPEKTFYDKLGNKIKEVVFLAGFQKTATSTISSILYSHPKICFPIKKEPFFFSTDEYNFGMGFYWKKYFEPVYDNEPVIVDANTVNVSIPYAIGRIAEKVPEAKLIVSLRNPVDRAYSHWWMYKASGEDSLSFEDAVNWEMEELREGLIPYGSENDDYWKWNMRRNVTGNKLIMDRTPRTYLTTGNYAVHIKRLAKYFNKKNVLFVFQENLRRNKHREVKRILDFLGLSIDEIPPEAGSKDYHSSRNSLLLTKFAGKMKHYQDLIPYSVLDAGNKLTRKLDKKLFSKTRMKKRTRERLIDFYQPKNGELEILLNKEFGMKVDLSGWDK
ncbi:MAG: sulfotransferase domain-containing protein [Candidatus Paceibacteria bacterium]